MGMSPHEGIATPMTKLERFSLFDVKGYVRRSRLYIGQAKSKPGVFVWCGRAETRNRHLVPDHWPMASLKDKVQRILSENSSLVLDAQILLGFQCLAMFHPKLVELLPSGKALKPFPLGGSVLYSTLRLTQWS